MLFGETSLSAGGIEYIDCISAEGLRLPNECPVDQSTGDVEYINCITAEG